MLLKVMPTCMELIPGDTVVVISIYTSSKVVFVRYTVLESDGNAHGVLFLNSNAQDVTLTPAPGLVYRTIGGVIDMYFFLGPDPESVVSQYTEAVGRYYIPPYWSLGFHLCRYSRGHKV